MMNRSPAVLKVWPVQPKRVVGALDGRRRKNKGVRDEPVALKV